MFNLEIRAKMNINILRIPWNPIMFHSKTKSSKINHKEFYASPKIVYLVTNLPMHYGYHKDICDDEIELCAHNVDTIVGPIGNKIGSGCVITWRGIFTLDPCNFWVYALIMKLDRWSLWFAMANWMRQTLSQFDGYKCAWSWNCSQWDHARSTCLCIW